MTGKSETKMFNTVNMGNTTLITEATGKSPLNGTMMNSVSSNSPSDLGFMLATSENNHSPNNLFKQNSNSYDKQASTDPFAPKKPWDKNSWEY